MADRRQEQFASDLLVLGEDEVWRGTDPENADLDPGLQLLDSRATRERVVDDSIVRFKLVGPHSVPLPIGSEVEMRLVHIFEMRDGKIAKETGFEMWKAL